MGTHPFNLAIRFILELAALFSFGLWGWRQSDNWVRFILVIGLPLILAAVWGTFAVPDDPSRSGNAPIVTPGVIRLIIELAFFAFATWTIYDMKYTNLSLVFVVVVILHYVSSYDRIAWLIAH